MGLTKRRIFILAGTVVATIPLLGASCAVNQTFANSGAPKIQFEGDSITFLATDDINAHYGATDDVAINAYVGATAYERMGSIATDAANHPQVAVINLGTNDAVVAITGRTLTVNGVTTSVGSRRADRQRRSSARHDRRRLLRGVRGVRHDRHPGSRFLRHQRHPGHRQRAVHQRSHPPDARASRWPTGTRNLNASDFDTPDQPHPNASRASGDADPRGPGHRSVPAARPPPPPPERRRPPEPDDRAGATGPASHDRRRPGRELGQASTRNMW